LAADGLVELRHGDGTYVSQVAKRASSPQLASKKKEFQAEFDGVVQRGLMLGVTPAELAEMLAKSVRSIQAEMSRPSK
jgi:DNA-binding FadR family transcriptional regulator